MRAIADKAGRASLPPVHGEISIAAWLPGFFGACSVAAAESGEVSVTILPDQTVTVRVLDASDAPVAGALVALNQRVPVVVGMEWAYEEMAALEREEVPGNRGLQRSDCDPRLDVSTVRRAVPRARHALKVASGFGGVQGAMVFSR